MSPPSFAQLRRQHPKAEVRNLRRGPHEGGAELGPADGSALRPVPQPRYGPPVGT